MKRLHIEVVIKTIPNLASKMLCQEKGSVPLEMRRVRTPTLPRTKS